MVSAQNVAVAVTVTVGVGAVVVMAVTPAHEQALLYALASGQ